MSKRTAKNVLNIPSSVKIGGKVYSIEITDKLFLGAAGHSAEIQYSDLVIRVCPQARQKMEADLLHEIVHGLFSHMGLYDHDEEQVERLAAALYMLICDNPEMFEKEDKKCTEQ